VTPAPTIESIVITLARMEAQQTHLLTLFEERKTIYGEKFDDTKRAVMGHESRIVSLERGLTENDGMTAEIGRKVDKVEVQLAKMQEAMSSMRDTLVRVSTWSSIVSAVGAASLTLILRGFFGG
jgi:CII-binding regulator of phage lambda lysogenization HflD